MSSDPLLDKMDALLKKHRGEPEAPAAVTSDQPMEAEIAEPPPLPDDAWLPVLTDVVAMGEPDTATSASPASPPQLPVSEAAPADTAPPAVASIDPDALVEQIMNQLEPRLGVMLRDRLAAEIRNSLDDTLSTLLAQMDVHIREIVRETINEQLGKP